MSSTLLAAEVALAGSLSFALGAALQQHEAAGTTGSTLLGRLRLLVRRPLWLLGGLAILIGGVGHFMALGLGPLTIVQPVTVASLMFAVPIAAALHRRRPSRAELAAAGAVTAGLVAFVLVIPPTTTPPTLTTFDILRFLPCAVLIALICHRLGQRSTPHGRAMLLAVASGVMYASAATLNRVLSNGAMHDLSRLFNWLTLLMPVVAAAALALLQSAYATGHFGVAYATVQIADPLTAVTIGALILHERLPSDPASLLGALGAGALVLAGTVALARISPAPEVAERPVPVPCPK
ncbi:DMT family transporter [Streptosporangium sp. NPDC004631]